MCLCISVSIYFFVCLCERRKDEERGKDKETSNSHLGSGKLVGGSLKPCMPAVTYMKMDIKVQLFVAVCGFIDGSS